MKLLLTGLLVLSFNVMAGVGERGNGGDAVAGEFSQLAGRTYLALKQVCTENPSEEVCGYIASLKKSVYQATITIEDKVYGPNGLERDATNDGSSEIKIGKLRWETLSPRKKLTIAVHEHLSLIRIESSDQYGYSNEIVNLLTQYGWTPTILISNEQMTKTYSGLQAMVLLNNELVPVFAGPTDLLGFCVHKGFKSALSFARIMNNWYPPTHIDSMGRFYGHDNNVVGPSIGSVTCGF